MPILTRPDGVPLYVQIRKSLQDDIENGILQPGQKISSEEELAAQFNVSRMTVRQGISDLIDEGLVYRRHGVGTFVTRPHIERDHSHLESFVEKAEEDGLNICIQVLIADILPAKLKVARSLSITESELVVRVKTLRFIENVPITVHDAYVPYKLFPQLLLEDLEARHLWSIYESYGYKVKRAVQRVEAREAEEDIANLLKMDEGVPILYKERIVYLDDGTPVEFTYCYNRGDRYSLTVVINR
jgi:GntR family transcriptional regulator